MNTNKMDAGIASKGYHHSFSQTLFKQAKVLSAA